MILIRNKEEKDLIKAFRNFVNSEEYSNKLQEMVKLKADIETLKIEKDRMQENHAKEERELRHMIGLEKKRQEFEIESAKKQTSLDVREENLKADKKRFEEHLKFNTERHEKFAAEQKDLLAEIIKRLPNVNMEIGRKAR